MVTMGADVRPELSKKNKYWIDKNRFYELKYFCLQYPIWKKAYEALDGIKLCSYDLTSIRSNTISDLTGRCVEERSIYFERIHAIEKASIEADPYIANYILKAVTEGYSYNYLKSRLEIPCGKDLYYDRYRRFFWILDQLRN